MSEVSVRANHHAESFAMKGGQFTIPTLILRDPDVSGLDEFLADQVARLPAFFDQAPIAIDVSQLPDQEQLADFPMVVGILRGHGMVPVGVRGASAAQQAQARALELAIMPAGRPITAAQNAKPSVAQALIVDKPVRSGQRIYADGGDLVLMAGVSSGAEVLAEGHIHAYGPLRGRAMAGVSGNVQSRVFCREFGAELVSIAGRYRVSENLESHFIGRALQISLSGESLEFSLL